MNAPATAGIYGRMYARVVWSGASFALALVAAGAGCVTQDDPLAADEQALGGSGYGGSGYGDPGPSGAALAVDDTAQTALDAPIAIAVLANDGVEPGGAIDASSVTLVDGPYYGAATVADGALHYTPGAGYRGSDLARYQVCGVGGGCSRAWVYIQVDPTSPVAAYPDTYRVFSGTTMELWVGENDRDLLGAPPLMTILVPATHGQVATDWGTVYYTGDLDYAGPDELAYQFCADGHCAATTVRFTVRGNAEPVVVDEVIVTDEDHPISFNVLANDSDPDGDPLRVAGGCFAISWPFNRTELACREDGWCDLSTAPQEAGQATLQCDVCDVLTCVPEIVDLTILRVPNPPECIPDTAVTEEDTPVEIRVLANDAFNAGRPAPETMEFPAPPAHGAVAVDPETGVVTYTPAADFAGHDSFGYHLCDVFGLCDGARVDVTVTGIEDPPAFTAAATNTFQDIGRHGLPVPLAAVDPEGGALVFAVISGELPPRLTLRPDGTFASTGPHRRGAYDAEVAVTDAAGLVAISPLRIRVH